MIVYWSMIIWTAFLGLFQSRELYSKMIYPHNRVYSVPRYVSVLWAGYLLFWIGLRSGIGDTNAYISSFNEYPLGLNNIDLIINSDSKGKAFEVLGFLFKNLISSNYHAWLFFIAFVSLVCMTKVFYRHSDSFIMTAYLFIASCIFTWLFNGIRQFLATSILFLFSEWFAEKKIIRYILLILAVSLIHNTALILIPIVVFFKNKNPWNFRTFLFIGVFAVGIYYADNILGIFTATEYGSRYADALATSQGTNIIRVIVAGVPCVLSFWERRIIIEEEDEFINMCTVMSLVSFCLYAFSSVTSGVLLGRLPNYFEVYNLILIPWLLNRGFSGEERGIIKVLCILMYLVFFYFQMTKAWNMYYISDFTGVVY